MADKKAFLLRVDPGVWTAILRLAQAELRSMNAEIEFLLRDALARRGICLEEELAEAAALPQARTRADVTDPRAAPLRQHPREKRA